MPRPKTFTDAIPATVDTSQKAYDFINGPADAAIPTDNGPVPSIAGIVAEVNATDAINKTQTAAAQAAAARDAAQAAAGTVGIFDTLAAANAAVASIPENAGVYVIADTSPNNGFYVQRGGALVRTLDVTPADFAALIKKRAGSNSMVVTDVAGNILIDINPTAVRHPDIDQIRARAANADFSSNAVRPGTGQSGLLITDTANNILAEFTQTTINHPDTNGMRAAIAALQAGQSADSSALAPLAQFLHFVNYGQSLSVGEAGTPIATTSLPPFAKKFVGGARPQDGGTDPAVIYPTLQPYTETISGVNGETPVGGMFQMLYQLLRDEEGVDISDAHLFLGSSSGEGGTAIQYLAQGGGTTFFTRLVETMTYGRLRANELAMTYGVAGMTFIQGESDRTTPYDVYVAAVRKLRADVEAAAQAASGDARSLPMLTYQTPSHLFYGVASATIAQAQLDLSADPLIAMATPIYFMPAALSDLPHLTAAGYRWLGAYLGLGWKRWLWDGVKPQPLKPSVFNVAGSTVFLSFPVERNRHLVIDTAGFPDPGNLGFTALDSTGSTVSINSVVLVGDGRVRIICASTPAVIRYGWIGNSYFGGGCLRDNSGDTLLFNPDGENLPMHRWVPIFELEIA